MPISSYGLSKKNAEEISKFFSIKSGINVLVLRLPGLYGGIRKSGYIYNVIKRAQNNELISLDTTNIGFWEAIKIDDCCRYISELLQCYEWEKKWYSINVAYGERVDFIETAHFIVNEIKSKSEIILTSDIKYFDLYLDNKRLTKYIKSNLDYYSSLKIYINSLI